MRRVQFPSTLIRILVVLSLFNLSTMTPSAFAATCTGADPCKACKNCKYCKHCAKDGGTCGVCKRGAHTTPSGESR
jgi:hypothetical protein